MLKSSPHYIDNTFKFALVVDMVVVKALCRLTSNAVGTDRNPVSSKFSTSLSITNLFNTSLVISVYHLI